MSDEKFIEILQKCYFGDRDAFNEIVAVFKEVTYDCDALLQEREVLWKTVKRATNNSSKLSKKLSRTEKKNKRYKEVINKVKSLLCDYEMQDDEIISLYCKEIRNALKEVSK